MVTRSNRITKDYSTCHIKLVDIRLDGGTQTRQSLDQNAITDYAEIYKQQVDGLPPVQLVYDESTYWLWDGFHRVEAAKLAGLETIVSQVAHGTQGDAVKLALGANATHGLRRTNDDKRRAVEIAVVDAELSKLTDRAIAKLAKVSHVFVAKIRSQVETLPPESRIGLDGKSYQTSNKPAVSQSQLEGNFPHSSASIVLDAIGREIPPQLKEAHALASQLVGLSIQLDRFLNEARRLSNEPGGQFIDIQAIEDKCKSLKAELTQARYWSKCPRCKPKGSCDLCNGAGFVPFRRRGLLTKPEKEELGLT